MLAGKWDNATLTDFIVYWTIAQVFYNFADIDIFINQHRQVAEILFERIDGVVSGTGRFFQTRWNLVERESVRKLL